MENLNRLKAVLADAGQTNKWLADGQRSSDHFEVVYEYHSA